MKGTLKFGLLALSILGSSIAFADDIGLTYINTNDINTCERISQEVNRLSTQNAQVISYCAYDVVAGYEFSLITLVSSPNIIFPGEYLQLANLDTNDPDQLLSDLTLLTHEPQAGSGRSPLAINLEGPNYFVSSQGDVYAYRIQVGVVVQP